jgi:Helix-turn-helix domain
MSKSNQSHDETQLAYFDRDKLIWGSCLKSNEKLLLHALNSFVGADGRCFPKHGLLAEMTSLGRSSIVRIMKSLEASCVVQVEWRYRPDGSQSSNDYFLDWEALKALNCKGVSKSNRGVSKSNTPVSNSDTGGLNLEHQELPNSTTQETTKVTAQGYTKSDSSEYADTGESNSETNITNGEPGSQSGLVSSGENQQDKGRGETHETQIETDPYAKPWNKSDRLREDKDGYAVLPPAQKHKMPRQTATRLAQYILHNEVDSEFELTLPPPGQQQCWVVSKSNTGDREDEALDPLRLLRSVNESNGSIDFNQLLNDCWQASVTFWEDEDALELFKNNPLAILFQDLLEDYDVEILDYDPDEWSSDEL